MSVTGNSNPLGRYLRARRESIQPRQVGIEPQPGRRVPGLRREEVAALAGMSADYYLRIEQGRDRRPSEQVITALARALLLDEDNRQYLLRLSRPRAFIRRAPEDNTISEGVKQLLAQWAHTPAYVSDANQNVLAANRLVDGFAPGILIPGTNMLVSAFDSYAQARAQMPDPTADDLAVIAEWEDTLRELTAALRYHGDPDDPRLQEIVGTLSARYPTFRTIWAEHGAKPQVSGRKRTYIAPLGWVEFRWQTLEIPRTRGQFITTFFGEPGSLAARAIAYLAARPSGDGDLAGDERSQPESLPDTSDARRSSATRASSSDGTKIITALSS